MRQENVKIQKIFNVPANVGEIVSLVNYRDTVIFATQYDVYQLIDDGSGPYYPQKIQLETKAEGDKEK